MDAGPVTGDDYYALARLVGYEQLRLWRHKGFWNGVQVRM